MSHGWFQRQGRRLRRRFSLDSANAELSVEMRHHFDELVAEFRAEGLSERDAHFAAHKEFGTADAYTESCRDIWQPSWLSGAKRDLFHAARSLRRSPAFTITALFTLALCLAANLTIFSVVDAVLLRPLPYPDSDRLVSLYNRYPAVGIDRAGSSGPNYFNRRNGAVQALASVSISSPRSYAIDGTRVPGLMITPEFFATLNVPLARGRTFTDDAMNLETHRVVIVTDEFRRQHFPDLPEVVGQSIRMDGETVEIIGVLPAEFRFLSLPAQVFRPFPYGPYMNGSDLRHVNYHDMIARLAPGITLAEAQSQIDAFNEQQLVAFDPNPAEARARGYESRVAWLHDDTVRDARPPLELLQGAALFLLLIGGVNLANLLLVRASSQSRELAVRQALGAGRRDIIGTILSETLLLGLGGGILGLVLTSGSLDLIQLLGTDRIPFGDTVGLNARLALLGLAAAFVVGGLMAVPVIAFTLRRRPATGLRLESHGGTTDRGAQRLRNGFIVVQICLAFVLLTGAGLLGSNLQRLLATQPGFQTENILAGWMNLESKPTPERLPLAYRLIDTLRTQPGVEQVAAVYGLPFNGEGGNFLSGGVQDSPVTVEDRTAAAVSSHFVASCTANYWSVLSIPLLAGRTFDEREEEPGVLHCVVDRAFAERYWSGRDPIGRRLTTGQEFTEDKAYTVIGVVETVKQHALTESAGHGTVYVPFSETGGMRFSLVVRTALPSTTLAPTIRRVLRQLDPEQAIDDLRPMNARIDESLITRRTPTILAGIFAGTALLLAALGTYGVLAYAIGQRRREIGIRMALGALPRQIRHHFLRLGGRVLATAMLFGLGGAWAAGRVIQTVFADIPAFQPGVVFAAAVLMSAVVLLATLIPS